jgi:hypothetical protein
MVFCSSFVTMNDFCHLHTYTNTHTSTPRPQVLECYMSVIREVRQEERELAAAEGEDAQRAQRAVALQHTFTRLMEEVIGRMAGQVGAEGGASLGGDPARGHVHLMAVTAHYVWHMRCTCLNRGHAGTYFVNLGSMHMCAALRCAALRCDVA